jgi:hypothetical protein
VKSVALRRESEEAETGAPPIVAGEPARKNPPAVMARDQETGRSRPSREARLLVVSEAERKRKAQEGDDCKAHEPDEYDHGHYRLHRLLGHALPIGRSRRRNIRRQRGATMRAQLSLLAHRLGTKRTRPSPLSEERGGGSWRWQCENKHQANQR